MQGDLIESDHWANAKAFLALLMTAATQVGTSAANSSLSSSHLNGGVALPDTSAIQAKYLDQLLNGQTGDGRFVRVPAGTEFYIFPTDTILPTHRSIGEAGENNAKDGAVREEAPLPGDPAQAAVEIERQLLKQTQQPTSQDGTPSPKFKY